MIKLLDHEKIDLKALEITDIVDLVLLQKFQDNFAKGMNCASVTVDRNGNPVTQPSSYTKFCTEFIHKSTIGDSRCAESHHRMGLEAARTGRPFIGNCHAGLIDFAAPIMVGGELVGTVLGGQCLAGSPEEEIYRKTAQEIGVSESGLVEAVHEIEATKSERISAAAEVLFIVVNSLAQSGYARLQLEAIAKRLAGKFVEISATLEELASSSQSIMGEQEDLNQEITQIGKFNTEIGNILALINKIAMNTKILGINSSIEAAHAGESGVGFAVVAREIKNLSDNSKETANEISLLTEKIKKSISETVTHSEVTLSTSHEQAKALEDVSNAVQQIVHLADELDNMLKNRDEL
ncbi:PocR ligand-binding domain-containing protein [Caproicibacter sp.]|uniref:PocR ligand-binding domain-containing protein n=1 Tax=Caproicibacter sp. TaxID=2814884 RepID=UPI003989F4A7